MRIVGGAAGGTNLAVPRNAKVRPTTDRVRDSLFNILSDLVVGARVMDLFAGSGSLGIEALSRGAQHGVFVEQRRECIEVIQRNLERAHLADVANVLRLDAYRVCSHRALLLESFDLIFLDPPYEHCRRLETDSRLLRLLEGLAGNRMVAAEGLVIVEHDQHADLPDNPPGLFMDDERSYGDTVLSFYAVPPEPEPTGTPDAEGDEPV